MVILYADDDEDDQEVFAEIVFRIDPSITIVRAADGLQAIDVLRNQDPPRMVFLDVRMPFLNGFQVLEQIRKDDRFKETAVVIYSTNAYYEPPAQHDIPGVRYVKKPNTIHEGIETLKPIIEKGRPTIPGGLC